MLWRSDGSDLECRIRRVSARSGRTFGCNAQGGGKEIGRKKEFFLTHCQGEMDQLWNSVGVVRIGRSDSSLELDRVERSSSNVGRGAAQRWRQDLGAGRGA
jgi:hypothetical protein